MKKQKNGIFMIFVEKYIELRKKSANIKSCVFNSRNELGAFEAATQNIFLLKMYSLSFKYIFLAECLLFGFIFIAIMFSSQFGIIVALVVSLLLLIFKITKVLSVGKKTNNKFKPNGRLDFFNIYKQKIMLNVFSSYMLNFTILLHLCLSYNNSGATNTLIFTILLLTNTLLSMIVSISFFFLKSFHEKKWKFERLLLSDKSDFFEIEDQLLLIEDFIASNKHLHLEAVAYGKQLNPFDHYHFHSLFKTSILPFYEKDIVDVNYLLLLNENKLKNKNTMKMVR